MEIPPILKNKWVLIGGAAVIVIAVAASSGGASTNGTVSAAGPSDAEVMASRDITLAQLSAQSQQNMANASLAAAQAGANADAATAALNAQLSMYAIDAQSAANNLQYHTNRDIQLAGLASADRQALAAIDMQGMVAKWTLDQATANAQIQTSFQLDYAEAANHTQVSLAQMQAQIVNNQLVVSRDVTLAGLATQEQLAAINANLQRDTTYSNNQTQQAVYATMTNGMVEQTRIAAVNQTEQVRLTSKASKHNSTMGMIGSVIGGIASIFSDPETKRNIEAVGTDANGLTIYAYEYAWGGGRHLGVMADEVATMRPDALGPIVSGFATVNYAALGHG